MYKPGKKDDKMKRFKKTVGQLVIAGIFIFALLLTVSCVKIDSLKTIDLTENWRFSPDKKNIGMNEKWYAVDFDDTKCDILNAGKRWEDQGYPELDGYGWYRKTVEILPDWEGKDIWLKIGAVNDAYELFVNGKSVSVFGQANISVANRPTFTEINRNLKFGESNQISILVNDWGNSGDLWRLPVIITIDKSETDLFKLLSETPFDPSKEGYTLFWEDNFDGNKLDSTKWAVCRPGLIGIGYITADAIEVKNGKLYINIFIENDSLKMSSVGTQGLLDIIYGYFECRAKLPKISGNWFSFWMQSPGISLGEDPAKFGTEIDIFENSVGKDGDFVSHNFAC
jgi:hypothetical protein